MDTQPPAAPPGNGHAPRRGATRRQTIDAVIRRQYVLSLRRTGATYEAIFQAATQRFGQLLPRGYNSREVHRDVLIELTKIETQLAEDRDATRTLELDRLDRLLMGIWVRATGAPPDLQNGKPAVPADLEAVDMVLKIMTRRARYLPGLEVPLKFAPTSPDGDKSYDPLEQVTDAYVAELSGLLAQYGQFAQNGHVALDPDTPPAETDP